MDLITAIKTRRSLRAYKAQDIPKEDVEGIIDAARFAPTARAVEPLEFIAVTNKETLKKISDLAENGRFIAQAAACIVVFSGDTKYYLEDGCAATENIL
ncbi:MAG: nitroreductase family protein, partial [Candidatus Omnitrophica bacterium]|nr:nitroreductase family protein [Candidatus Omnitrophota bacterium]